MKTLSLEQMEVINGGTTEVSAVNNGVDGAISPCRIAKGVAGIGGGLLVMGVALSGGFATGVYAGCVVFAAICEVPKQVN